MLRSESLGPVNVTLLGSGVLADRIVGWMWAPIQGLPKKRLVTWTWTHWENAT